jgi:NADPH2:quinone reductase
VRIAVAYASVGYALLLQTSGRYQRKPPLPFVPGTEVSGTVLEVAPELLEDQLEQNFQRLFLGGSVRSV